LQNVLGKLTIEKFESALKKSPYKFNEKHIHDIINDAPKNRKNEIMYRQLHFLLSVGLWMEENNVSRKVKSPEQNLVQNI